MEFTGTVLEIFPAVTGQSARGEWQRQDVLFELPSEFNRKLCVKFFNKPAEAARLQKGGTYTVSINVESREHNGRWYTEANAWRVSDPAAAGSSYVGASTGSSFGANADAPVSGAMPASPTTASGSVGSPDSSFDSKDDLPF